ncbi:MAG: winged helix-turn-helix transcriptional regulator [Gemmatimonadetes bacterium]|nr:winged helix-turn-helix transcriptional regulator [Gemmatimonadota bacterium]
MTRVIVLGADPEEARRLSASLIAADPGVRMMEVPDGGIAGAQANASAVIVAAAAGQEHRLRERVEEAVDAGLPVVALLPDADLHGIDPARGHLEFCVPPFTPREVLLRVRAAAERAAGPAGANVIHRGQLTIDADRYQVTIGGRRVVLTYKEYELLRYLASRPGKAFSRQTLLRAVWGYDYFGGTRTVDVHVRRLRSKINDVEHHFIETVWNVGYRFRSEQPEASG